MTASLREAAQLAADVLLMHHSDPGYREARIAARTALNAALDLPDAEPAIEGYKLTDARGNTEVFSFDPREDAGDWISTGFFEPVVVVPLYAAPQPAEPKAVERVALSDYQKMELWNFTHTRTLTARQLFNAGIDASERKHNIKGAA